MLEGEGICYCRGGGDSSCVCRGGGGGNIGKVGGWSVYSKVKSSPPLQTILLYETLLLPLPIGSHTKNLFLKFLLFEIFL
jgi:hypothetical protein